jgi:outer membrane protein assembly factor BamB
VILSLLLTVGLGVAPDDWSRFRGPDGAGRTAFTLADDVDIDAVVWRADLPGAGHSSPVVSGGRVVLTCADAASKRRSVVAFDSLEGHQLWRYDEAIEPHRQHQLNSYASATPALGEGRVHILWTKGDRLEALSLSLDDGSVLWRREFGVFTAQHGSAVSPVLAGGVLLVPNEHEGAHSFLAGLDPATGDERWRIPRTSAERRGSYATPAVLHGPDGARALFASTAHGLTAVDPRTGEIAWHYDPGFEMRCVGSPVVAGGIVFQTAGSGGGGKEYIALRLPGQDTEPSVAWSTRLRALPYVPTPVAHAGLMFLISDSGVATCVEASSGAVRWQERLDGRVYASPLVLGERLVVVTIDGTLLLLDAKSTFALRAKVALGATCQATPAVAGPHLLVRAGTELLALQGE